MKLVSELTPLTVHEGDDATFQCEVSPPDAQVTWLRNGAVVTPGPQLQMVQNGSSHTLIIRGCQLKDTGTVTARVGATDTSARLHVRGLVLLRIKCPFPETPSQFWLRNEIVRTSLQDQGSMTSFFLPFQRQSCYS